MRNRQAWYVCCLLLIPTLLSATTETTYGERPMEWRTFITNAAVTAFAVSGSYLAYATATDAGIYDMSKNTATTFEKLGTVSAADIHAIAVGPDNAFWFGTTQGILVSRSGKTFSPLTTTDTPCHKDITCITSAPDGSMWVGTKTGICRFRTNSWESFGDNPNLAATEIRDIIVVEKDEIWCATNKGIAVYSKGTWTQHSTATGMGSNDVHRLAWDKRKKVLWTAEGTADIGSFDGEKWNIFMDVHQDIKDLMVDTQSRLWVGTADGIMKYNGFEWISGAEKIGFGAALANDLNCDDQGDMWFAIETGVLHLKNPYPF